MTEHLRSEELADVLVAPEHDPRRRHAASCARCAAELAAFAKFMAPGAGRAGTDVADARARLDAAMAREIGGAAPHAAAAPADPSFGDRLRQLFRPQPAWFAAGVAITVALVLTLGRRPDDTLRSRTETAPEVVLEPSRAILDSLEIRWHTVPGAEAYNVSLTSTSLVPIATVSVRDTFVRVAVRNLAPFLHRGDLLYVRVTALRLGSTIATSAPMTASAP